MGPMQDSAHGCRWDELFWKKLNTFDGELLHWVWEGVYRSVLERVMSLASTNPHQMLCAETTLDQWHCGNDTETWD